MEQYSSDNILVPGELIGYREWSVDFNGLLYPITYSAMGAWTPGVNEARCGLSVPGGQVPHRRHSAVFDNELEATRAISMAYGYYSPGVHAPLVQGQIASAHQINFFCDHCGIYGKYNWTKANVNSSPVIGAIAASGRIVLGTKGFRAQKARILALSLPEYQSLQEVETLQASVHYGVRLYANPTLMLQDFPPSDLNVVAPEVAETLRQFEELQEQARRNRLQSAMAAVSVAEYLERNSQIHGEGQI